MLTGTDIVNIPIGARFIATYDFVDDLGNAEDFTTRTAAVKLKNIFDDADNKEAIDCPDTVTVQPLDSESNAMTGRIALDIGPTLTAQLEVPEDESDPYGESGIYAIIQVTFDNGEIPLIIKVKPIKTI